MPHEAMILIRGGQVLITPANTLPTLEEAESAVMAVSTTEIRPGLFLCESSAGSPPEDWVWVTPVQAQNLSPDVADAIAEALLGAT
jgi:hypothetical protein